MAAIALLLGIRVGNSWSHNLAANTILKQMRPVEARCVPLDAQWTWNGGDLPANTSDYGRAVAASFGAPAITEVSADGEQHDPRLVAWLQALHLARQGHAEESVPYFKAAGAGHMFLAAGHATYHSDPVCTVFNWVLAHEIGQVGPSPDPPLTSVKDYVASLIATGQAETVIGAYSRLLTFEPGNADWRLTLAEAHLALQQLPAAEEVLQPLLSVPNVRDEAEALLRTYRTQHP
jgi:hypothetical protein